jgi:hypothetical protein
MVIIMTNKTIFILVGVILASTLFIGCVDTGANSQQQYAQEQGVAGYHLGDTWNAEALATEKNQQQLVSAVPIPYLQDSLERKNIARRLDIENTPDKIFYVYLVNYGKVMAYYVAKGKISSVNSQITTPQQIVASADCLNHAYSNVDRSGCYHVVDSPQQDGSYGTNGD